MLTSHKVFHWYLENGIALAHEIERPYLEVTGLAHWAQLGAGGRFRWERSAAGRRSSKASNAEPDLAERAGYLVE